MGVGVEWGEDAVEGYVPVGSVEFGEGVFGVHRRDFYPEFLAGWMHRGYQRVDERVVLGYELFVKDASRWKGREESRIWEAGEVLPDGDWWVSEVVSFVQEWRWYVADGKVVTTGWYAGEDEDEAAPELEIEWPDGFSGAVDFGRLVDGRMALVEAHAPFACGWYGERHADYARWMLEAWANRGWWFSLG